MDDEPEAGTVFAAVPWVQAISHVHTPHLGAWSLSPRPFPIRFVPLQRETYAEEVPVYLDRREREDEHVIRLLGVDPEVPAVLEGNGSASVWSRNGVCHLARLVLLLKEAARLQTLAELVGGARPYGPGVLESQWIALGLADHPRARTRLEAERRRLGLGAPTP